MKRLWISRHEKEQEEASNAAAQPPVQVSYMSNLLCIAQSQDCMAGNGMTDEGSLRAVLCRTRRLRSSSRPHLMTGMVALHHKAALVTKHPPLTAPASRSAQCCTSPGNELAQSVGNLSKLIPLQVTYGLPPTSLCKRPFDGGLQLCRVRMQRQCMPLQIQLVSRQSLSSETMQNCGYA